MGHCNKNPCSSYCEPSHYPYHHYHPSTVSSLRNDKIKTISLNNDNVSYELTFDEFLTYNNLNITVTNTALNATTPLTLTLTLPDKETTQGKTFWRRLESRLCRKLKVNDLISMLFITLSGNVKLEINIDGNVVETYYNDFYRVSQVDSPNQPTTNMVSLRHYPFVYTQDDQDYRCA
jgi:hypothetical protein